MAAKPKLAKPDKKKPQPKSKAKRPAAKPKITDAMFEAWFFKRTYKQFVQLTSDWNDLNLKIKLKKHDNYDQWLNYFKTLSPNQIKVLAQTGLDILDTEAYSALSRWHDIITHPGRIDKIHRAGLTTGKENQTIIDLAAKNDRYGVLCAIRDELAIKLQKGAGSRDTAALASQLTEVMTQIADYEKRLGPKKETTLGKLLGDMPELRAKRPPKSKSGVGARQTSFKSRVTIEDIEKSKG